MGAQVPLKKKAKEIPVAEFCVAKSGCSKAPVMRLREMQTHLILDLCGDHGEGLLRSFRHAYATEQLPEGIIAREDHSD